MIDLNDNDHGEADPTPQYVLEDHYAGVDLHIIGLRRLIVEYEAADDGVIVTLANLKVGEDFYQQDVLVRRIK